MRNICFFSIIIFFSSCRPFSHESNENETNGKTWKFELDNNLGIVTIILPKHLDSFFSWTQYGDCGDGCAFIDYRVQPKILPVYKESGWIFPELTDSVEQFTLKHRKRNYQWGMHDSVLSKYLRYELKASARNYPSKEFVIDTTLFTNNRIISVIGYSVIDSNDNVTSHYLSASTPLNDNLLEIFFEYRKAIADSSSKDFIKNAFRCLKTLEVTNGS